MTVSLLQSGTVIRQATTVNGVFTLTDVPVGQTFYARFNLPTGYTLGPTDSGADATDNDFDVTSTYGATIAEYDFLQVAEGQTLDIDAGIVQGANLTVFCWNDADGDGIQDAGTPEANGLANVDVTLRPTGTQIYAYAGLFSSANGTATFTNVRPGTFNLVFTHSTFVRTLKDQGGNDTLDSDADQTTGNTINFTLTPGSTRTDFDAGFRDPALVTGSISGKAWRDNGDGIRQTTETTLTGIHVLELYRSTDATVGNADDQFVTSTATNTSQNYTFSGLAPGSYYVRSVVPANHVITLQNQGTSDLVDSDFLPSTRNSGMLVITAGAAIANVDVGFIPGNASIGNFIWNDLDRDGIQDATETGLAGAIVTLFSSANVQIGAPVTTTATGSYSFTGLLAGQYYVKVTPPAGYLMSPRDQGLDDTKDSDMDPVSRSTALITLAAGTAQTQWDAGMYLGAKVGDKVWLDTDGDGQQDTGELGKQGVIVRLKTAGPDGIAGSTDDVQVAQTSTNASGNYEFLGVTNGTYYVQFTAPTGFLFTRRDVGSDLTDSDAGLTNGRTAKFTIANFVSNLTIDAGLVQAGSVTVHVGPDIDRGGVLDPGGKSPGLEVILCDPVNGFPGDSDDVLVRRGVTDVSGNITFSGLWPKSYFIRIMIPGGYEFTIPDQGTNEAVDSDIIDFCCGYGNTRIFTVNPGLSTAITAGILQTPGAISGIVWNDANRNKVRDGALIQGSQPDVVIAIDNSGSTSEIYPGSPVGDVNGDGQADTILDAEILAAISVVQQLTTAGYGTSCRIGIVTFNGTAAQLDLNPVTAGVQISATPAANVDGDSTPDVIEALFAIRSGGATNFEAALQKVVSTFTTLATPAGRGTLLFFSDGAPTTGGIFTDEVTALQTKGIRLKAFGTGTTASLSNLQLIDPMAAVYAATDDLFSVIQLNNSTGFALERGMDGIRVYLDLDLDNIWDSATEPSVITSDDDPDTDTIDETGTFLFSGIAPGSYVIREVLPAGYSQTLPGTSDPGWTATVIAGKTSRNADFGNAGNPTLTGLPAAVTYKANTAAVILAPAAVVADPDNAVLSGGSLSVQVKVNPNANDVVAISHQGTAAGQIGVSGNSVSYGGVVIGTFTGGTGSVALVVTFNSQATTTAVQALARRITFRNTLAVPPIAQRTIEWKLTDLLGGGVAVKTEAIPVTL